MAPAEAPPLINIVFFTSKTILIWLNGANYMMCEAIRISGSS